jgi:hypothetical protein
MALEWQSYATVLSEIILGSPAPVLRTAPDLQSGVCIPELNPKVHVDGVCGVAYDLDIDSVGKPGVESVALGLLLQFVVRNVAVEGSE